RPTISLVSDGLMFGVTSAGSRQCPSIRLRCMAFAVSMMVSFAPGSAAAGGQRGRAQLRKRERGADGLRIDHAMQNGWLAGCQRAFERGSEFFRFLDAFAVSAECAGVGGEVGVAQFGGADAAWILPLL